ncbi:MAG: DUF5675 family protein [Ferruginibacter sp.]
MQTLELLLHRNYYPAGTNGTLYIGGIAFCRTIELPNKNNQHGISCIPEGRYKLQKRTSEHHGEHLILLGVMGRDLILIHKANDALKELRGCIAPVTTIIGEGKGTGSKLKFDPLIKTVYAAINGGKSAYLTITKTPAI